MNVYVVAGPGSLIYECASAAEVERIAALDSNAGVFVSHVAAERYAATHQPGAPSAQGRANALAAAGMLADSAAERREVSQAARAMRAINSPAQAEAARENGRRGGRPRKVSIETVRAAAADTCRGSFDTDPAGMTAASEMQTAVWAAQIFAVWRDIAEPAPSRDMKAIYIAAYCDEARRIRHDRADAE